MENHYIKYGDRARRAINQLLDIKKQKKSHVVLKNKSDRHIYRNTFKKNQYLNIRHFTQVIHVNLTEMWVDVEGMISYHDLVNFLLPLNVMPKIVPELRSITVGGAISGVGIEATSFKYGLVHETIVEMDVLTGNAELVTCKKNGINKELFHAIPNSYGVFGYILRARVEIIPTKPYIKILHEKFSNPELAFKKMKEKSEDHENNFLEGVVFSPSDFRILTGKYVDFLPKSYEKNDFRIENVFYHSVQHHFNDTEYLKLKDFLWRWDADAYWMTDNTILQKKWLRKLVGKWILRSDRLHKISRSTIYSFIENRFDSNAKNRKSMIQDIVIPEEKWLDYFNWYGNNLKKFPLWLCPARMNNFPLFKADQNKLYCDFGTFNLDFSDYSTYRNALKDLEKKLLELGGTKCFYSDNALSKENFYNIVNEKEYVKLKEKYDPMRVFPDLFEKCVAICD